MPNGVVIGLVVAVLVVTIDLLAGHPSRGKATRPAPDAEHPPDPAAQVPMPARWYIESTSGASPLPHSCSFVEFDERGDYLNFEQHRHAYEKIEKLAGENAPLTLVIFVHGWRHSGQSANVVDFNEFLHQLAVADQAQPRRVHGVYLAWRGASFKHPVKVDDKFQRVVSYFGGEIIDPRERAKLRLLNFALETLSYFSRKSVPEFKFGGTCISRTIFSCAYSARRNQPDAEVLLFGHSFGGLMLERTFQNAAISSLTEAWPWGKPEEAGRSINPLPFDTVLMINSAAPSIYAKQFQSYLAAHRQAMLKAGVPCADTPIVFSLTSTADRATGRAHPLANSLCWLVPTLRRRYRGDEFILERVAGSNNLIIPQWRYYQRTPGHNPLLVNRFIEAVSSAQPVPTGRRGYVTQNLDAASGNPLQFSTTVGDKKESRTWRINFPPETEAFRSFSTYEGRRPLAWTKVRGRLIYKETAYWIIRCPREIISSHNDIWSQSAMDTYAALHRLSRSARFDGDVTGMIRARRYNPDRGSQGWASIEGGR